MKRLCVILLAASAMLANRTHFVINFDADDIRFSRVSGYDVVILPDLPTITEVGMPGLPVKTMHVALSSGQKAIGVTGCFLSSLPKKLPIKKIGFWAHRGNITLTRSILKK